jgi:hypothetical protein
MTKNNPKWKYNLYCRTLERWYEYAGGIWMDGKETISYPQSNRILRRLLSKGRRVEMFGINNSVKDL